MLRPIGNRILIKPEANDEQTESGLILVEHKKPETMGTVIAVGPCPHPLKDEALEMADHLARWATLHDGDPEVRFDDLMDGILSESAFLLRRIVVREPLVKVGDLVVFPWTAGREVTLDDTGDRYLMMTEEDILAVIEQ